MKETTKLKDMELLAERNKMSSLRMYKAVVLTVIFLCLVSDVDSVEYLDPAFTDPTLEDSNGNRADINSQITWADLPEGTSYSAGSGYNDGGLAPLFNFARSFINTVQPNAFPQELVLDVIENNFQIENDYMRVVNYAIGFAVCFVIGILFIIVMPIVGCCFCLCRCCGCCGGRMVQKHSDYMSCKRTVYAAVLFVLTVFMAVGMICTYVTSDHMSTAIGEIQTTGVKNIDDISSYLNNTLEEMNYVANDGFGFAADVIIRDLDNIGYLVGIPVRDRLGASGVDTAINAIIALESSITSVATAMFAVNNSISNLKNNGNELSLQLMNVSESIKAIQTNNPDPACKNGVIYCQGIPADDLVMEVNFTSLPDISREVQQMEDVQSQSLADKANQGKQEFQDIPSRITNETATIVSDLKTQLDGFKTTIKNQLSGVLDLPTKVLEPIENVKKDLNTYGKMINDYNHYRWLGGVALSAVILLIVLLQFLGLLFGLCGSSASTNPTQRGCLSNCGGLMLMAAVGFIFIFSWLLMLLTSVSFLIGGNLEKVVCEPLTDPEYKIFELVDGPSGLLSKDGYFLGKMLFQNGSIPLNISGILKSCEKNEAAYSALKLENLFNLDQVTDYSQNINIDAELAKVNDSVNLGDVKILNSDAENQLLDFSNAVQIDFAGFMDELSRNTTKVNLTDFADLIRAAGTGSSQAVIDELDSEANKLEAMDSGIAKDVSDSQDQLLAAVQALNQSVSAVPDVVNKTIEDVKAAERSISTQAATIIPSEVTKYVQRLLGVADSFVNFTLNAVKHDIGGCSPLYNLWNSLINLILCKYSVDTFNGFWFSLGWAIFFMVPSIIFNVKLAKYFRRMKYADEIFPIDPNMDTPLSRNKVAPA